MFEGHDPTISAIVLARRLLSPAQLESARTESAAAARPLADVLLERRLLEPAALLRAVAEHAGAGYTDEVPGQLSGEVMAALDGTLARHYGVVPVRADAATIELLAADPLRPQLAADLRFALEREVRLTVADPTAVGSLLRRHYGEGSGALAAAAGELVEPSDDAGGREELSEADLERLAGRAPVVRYVNLVLAQAIRDQASDIHFEPFEREFKIRCRVDGTLHELPPPPKALALPVISRLKVLANLNIAERRLPQDGRIKLTSGGRAVDLRISTLPTQFGESVVLRVLDQSAVRLDITQLGLPGALEAALRGVIRRPNGILVVTGPTGSGKTTTLYSCLKVLNSPDVKILTVEDPVEYEIEGVMQVPVNHAAHLTFARALRSFLRQDPDVVMVGEIRDLETAQIALQASLTGHLVLTTLHTNDAPAAITRLIDMGAEPFLLASTVEAVLAQRLVRRLCPDCKTVRPPDAALLAQCGIAPTAPGDRPLYAGQGCAACAHTGYRGRLGLFEFLRLNDELRDLIVAGAPLAELRQKAIALGMTTLREAGWQAVLAGETTLEEIARYT